jgi:hypothetical protein
MRIRRCIAVGVAALSVVAALPAAASATDYCVVPNTGCGGTNVATFSDALGYADDDTDPDRIFLGAFEYVAPGTAGFDYSKTGAPVEIVGKGAGQTILTAPSGASSVLRLFGSASSSVRDLRIEIPANAGPQFNGLSTDGVARRIDVVEDQTQLYDRNGVRLENGGTLQDSSVTLSGAPGSTAIWTDVGGGTVRGTTVFAHAGVAAAHGATIERSRFVASGVAVAAGPGVTTVNSSVLHVFGQPGVGLLAHPLGSGDVTINADGLTILAPGHQNQQAASVSTYWAPALNADINLKNSIIRGGNLEATASGTGHAKITVSYSDLNPSGNDVNGAATASISLSNTSNVGDAGFADAQLFDYHLLPSSPLIDAGDPDTPAGSDLDGKPLVVDGNGDGTARRDMGAFEYQTGLPGSGDPPPPPPAGAPGGAAPLDTQAPLIGGFRATPSLFALARAATPVSAGVARGTRFRYTLSEAARVTVRIQRARPGRRSGGRCVAPSARLLKAKRCTRYVSAGTLRRSGAKGANSIRFTGRIGTRALGPGRYRATITASDAAGNRSARSSTAFRIAAR